MSRRWPRGSDPPLSAVIGVNDEARTAGASPNRPVTIVVNAIANASARQSGARTMRTGSSAGASIETMNGADHQPKIVPTMVDDRASKALSISTSRIKRQRSAPIDTRRAISRPRVIA